MYLMYAKIILLSLLALLVHHGIRVVWLLGYHKTVYNHSPGPCHTVPGVEFGSEDLETLPNGLTFISSGVTIPGCVSNSLETMFLENNVKGRILLFDFNQPEKGVTHLPIIHSDDFNEDTFAPHGLSLYQSRNTGAVFLFVINHVPEGERIEKFEFIEAETSLKHVQVYTDPLMHMANDVAATGEDSFYFTNYASVRSRFRMMLEVLLQLPWGDVVYCEGALCSVVADGLLMPNGVTVSNDGSHVYVTNGMFSALTIYQRENDNSLSLVQEFKLPTDPDNMSIEPRTGNLIIGAHPLAHRVMAHSDDPTQYAPSQVLMIHMKNVSHAESITELYSDDGHTLWGSSVASIYDQRMLIGTVFHKLLYCEVKSVIF